MNVKELKDYRKYTSNNGTDKNSTSSEYINESITSIFEDINNIPSSNDDDINTNVTLSKYLTSEADNVILRLGHPRKTADETSIHHVNAKELNNYRKYTSEKDTYKNSTPSKYIHENTTSIFEDINNVPSSSDVNNSVTSSKYLTSEAENVVLRLGYPRKTTGYLTIGLCTVPRLGASYLMTTLQSLIQNMADNEKKEVVIVIYLGSLDEDWVTSTAESIDSFFHDEILDGIILAVQPRRHIYPDFGEVTKRNFNDSLQRVHWRTKQNIDFAILFAYSKNLSRYYIHIEDDVIAARNFVGEIKAYQSKLKTGTWFCIEFSTLGFIGKLFHSYDLEVVSNFLLLFKDEQPCDLLINHLKRIMLQPKDIRSTVGLFQHRGVISSLKDKRQLLTDNSFKDKKKKETHYVEMVEIINPSAYIKTNLSKYSTFSPEKAFSSLSSDYFWASSPTKGSYYKIEFKKPTNLFHVYVKTGHPAKPNDILKKGEIHLKVSGMNNTCGKTVWTANFIGGIVEIGANKSFFVFNIKCVVIVVTENQSNWVIISEIKLN